MRVFLGIALPQAVQSSLDSLQRAFAASPSGIRWVGAAQRHITVKFFGEITQPQQESIALRLKQLLQAHPAFSASLDAVGGFPSLRLPRVLWVGVGQGRQRLVSLAEAVERESQALGFKSEERAFHPHVTLARIDSERVSRRIGEAAAGVLWAAPEAWRVAAVNLYRSSLSADGPRYEVLEAFGLSK